MTGVQTCALPILEHSSRPGGILLQVGPSLIDMDREFRGGEIGRASCRERVCYAV